MTPHAVIREAIVQWDQTTSKGRGPGEFVFLLSERERDELATAIELALMNREISSES